MRCNCRGSFCSTSISKKNVLTPTCLYEVWDLYLLTVGYNISSHSQPYSLQRAYLLQEALLPGERTGRNKYPSKKPPCSVIQDSDFINSSQDAMMPRTNLTNQEKIRSKPQLFSLDQDKIRSRTSFFILAQLQACRCSLSKPG